MMTLLAKMPEATAPSAPDFAAIKQKQNAAWASGNYARIGTTLQIVGEMLAENLDLPPGTAVLDVAAGNGNATLAFARRGGSVTSTDYVPTLLAGAQMRAEAEGLNIDFQIADVEGLPFEDASFDAVTSTFGVMFAPNQKQAASELMRVVRPGGKIAMANWTPDGFIGRLFRVLGGHVTPPAGVKSPALWGTSDWLNDTFSATSKAVVMRPQTFVFRYASPAAFLEEFRTYYGPVHKAFASLSDEAADSLASDILALVDEMNTAKDGTMRVPSEYAEVVIERA